jgi:ribokinase
MFVFMIDDMLDFDILTFGSITLDILIPIPERVGVELDCRASGACFLEVPLGDKIQVNQSLVLCGGGAANSAVGFSKLGLKTAIFGVMGDKSNKGFLLQELARNGVNTDYLTFAEHEASSFSVILNSWQGERTVLHRRTQSDHFGAADLQNAPRARGVYVSHIYPGSDHLLDLIPERRALTGELFGWNPGKTQFKKGFSAFESVFPAIDVLILNVEEAEMFTGLEAEKISYEAYDASIFGEKVSSGTQARVEFLSDVRALAEKFLNAGVGQVVITDGGAGAQLFTNNAHFWTPSQGVKKIDTLGAGDAFSTGILAAKIYKKSIREQLLWGSFASAGVIGAYGAQAGQLKKSEMEKAIRRLG